MVKLAYTLDLGSNAMSVQVQVLSSAPNKNNTNRIGSFFFADLYLQQLKLLANYVCNLPATRAADALGISNLLARIAIDSVVETNFVCETHCAITLEFLSLQVLSSAPNKNNTNPYGSFFIFLELLYNFNLYLRFF